MSEPAHAADERVVMIETELLVKNYDIKQGLIGQMSSLPAIISDVATLKTLLEEFGLTGKFVTKTTNGRQYIILKGDQRAREVFRGTRYLKANPKIVEMAIGRLGAASSVTKGSFLTVFVYCFVDAPKVLFEYRDKTLGELGVRFGSDLTKIALSGLAGAAAGALAAGSGVVVAPLAAAIIVGIGVGMGLDYIDQRFKITEQLEAYAREKQEEFEKSFNRGYQQFEDAFFHWLCSQGRMCVPRQYR
ncbi:MAG: hypothetical protein AB8G99_22790 [Planctomycetaceae bacterium]